MRLDEVTAAVLSREEVARYTRGGERESAREAAARIQGYLAELRTTQRYPLYRALQHPLHPILRKLDRRQEHVEHALAAVRADRRVIYASNHKSHLDYLVQPLVLDDAGVRPPVIAAGINLFGGPLGLIHRHVTGAIPIRREMKDPAYLATLKAYVSEVLRRSDLFLYPEGGRSYSGELKPLKTGLLHAAAQARRPDVVVVPVAIAYDLVLEDLVLSRQGTKRQQRPFPLEVAEMARQAVGYQSRAVVSFGEPIPLADYDPDDRRSMVRLVRCLRTRMGQLYKVLPTALVAAAMRPALHWRELAERIDELLDQLRLAGANLDVRDGREAVDAAAEALEARGVIAFQGEYCRICQRQVVRYYARTIEHLLGNRKRTAPAH